MKNISIGLIGDFNPTLEAHKAIPYALYYSGLKSDIEVNFKWINTSSIGGAVFLSHNLQGIWCVPASPYNNPQGVLDLIKFARELQIPFLGTCGGFQHALIDYARNVLKIKNAATSEEDPEAEMKLISKLSCALIEVEDEINIVKNTHLYRIMGENVIKEKYHCSYGLNSEYLSLFDNQELVFTAYDKNNEAKAFELNNHPFFVGTAFQPERSGLKKTHHPLIVRYLETCLAYKSELSGFGYNRSDY